MHSLSDSSKNCETSFGINKKKKANHYFKLLSQMTNDSNNETIKKIARQLYLNKAKSIFALSKTADTIQPTPSR